MSDEPVIVDILEILRLELRVKRLKAFFRLSQISLTDKEFKFGSHEELIESELLLKEYKETYPEFFI